MAVTTNKQVWPQTPKTAGAVCTAAKTTYSDTTNAVALMTAGSNGSVVTRIQCIPRAQVSTAIQGQLFLDPAAAGTVYLLGTVTIPVSNVTTTTGSVSPIDFNYANIETADGTRRPLRLATGDKLWVGIASVLAGGVVFEVEYADY